MFVHYGNLVNPPLFSVCIPTWNGEQFIEETIQSVLNSTYKKFEIIISDDFSTDGTVNRIRRLADDRISLFCNKKNLGVPANWNVTLAKAKGDFICFLNQDDVISAFWLQYANHIFQNHKNVHWIISAFRVITGDGSGKESRVVQKFPENRVYMPAEVFPIAILQNGFSPGFCMKRKTLDALQGFDEAIGPSADNELFIRLATWFNMFYSTCPHTSWRSHPENLTHRWRYQEQTNEGLRILKKTFYQTRLPKKFAEARDKAYQFFYYKTCLVLANLLKMQNYSEFLAVFRELAQDIECRPGIFFS